MNSTFRDRDTAIRPVSAKHSAGGTRIAPASFSQQALWVLSQVLPEESVYNESDVFRLRGALDVEALEASINEIVRRHEVLRTRFAVEDGEPVQVIVRELTVPLQVTDLSALPDGEREAEAQRLARRMKQRLGCDGINLINSCESAAWQTVFHFHIHVIPRYDDDPLVLPVRPQQGDEEEIAAVADELRGQSST